MNNEIPAIWLIVSGVFFLLGIVVFVATLIVLGAALALLLAFFPWDTLRGPLNRYSDLAGELSFDRARKVPLLTGKLQSRSLDYDDLAPLIGLPEQARSAAAVPQVKGERAKPLTAPVRTAAAVRGHKVLPEAALDLSRLKAMEADVQYEAERIVHVRPLPLNRAKVHVRMKDGVLHSTR